MRLFIGIEIPKHLCAYIKNYASALEIIAPGRYVREDMYHITLAYIGESDACMKNRAVEAMAECAANESPVELSLASPWYFGKKEKAILHLTIENGDKLTPISEHLRSLLDRHSLPYDPKPLCAHITLARNVRITDTLLATMPDCRTMRATGLTLFNSCRIDGLLSYVPIARIDFSK